MKKHFLVSLAIGCVCLQATAQQSNSTQILDSVTITENRLPAILGTANRNIQVLDAAQIKTLPVRTTNELLSYIGGVDLRQRGPVGVQTDVSIDGSTFDQVLVLVNGVKMSDPQTGHRTLNVPIPLAAIERIEVLRGPVAYKYGLNALAGAINIVTKKPQQNSVFAQVYGGSNLQTDTASSDTYYGWGAQASAALVGKHQQHTFSAAHDRGNGYRYNTAFETYRLFYQNRFELNAKNAIEAMGGYIQNHFGANSYYAAPGDKESEETVQTAIGSIQYQYNPTSRLSIRPRINYRYNNDDYIYIRQKPAVYHNIHETDVVTGELQSSLQLGNGVAGAGVEYRYEHIRSNNLGLRERNNLGVYAEYKHRFSSRFNAGLGVYGNYNSDYVWQFFPGLDVGYQPHENWRVFANASAGQRIPTYTDLYYKGPTNVGNAQLRPEYAKYAEAGAQYTNTILQLRAVYFYRNSTDFIDWVRAQPADPWQPQNFQTINTTGIALQAMYDMGGHIGLNPQHSLQLRANYTYLNPDVQAPSAELSKYATDALRNQFTAMLQSVWYGNWQVNVQSRYLYRINANDYTLLDARIGYRISKWNVYADVNNILNTQYKEIAAIPLPGRWYTVGVNYTAGW